MWSGAPAVKQEHQLRTNGPYSITRHPIYTGMLGMLLGCLLVTGGGRWVVPFPVFLVLPEIKLRPDCRWPRLGGGVSLRCARGRRPGPR